MASPLALYPGSLFSHVRKSLSRMLVVLPCTSELSEMVESDTWCILKRVEPVVAEGNDTYLIACFVSRCISMWGKESGYEAT